MEILSTVKNQLGPIPPRLRFVPECEGLVDFLQFQYCEREDVEYAIKKIAAVRSGARIEHELMNHNGAYARVTATTVGILYNGFEDEPPEGPPVVLEMPLAQFERILAIWREHCEDYAFAGTFEV